MYNTVLKKTVRALTLPQVFFILIINNKKMPENLDELVSEFNYLTKSIKQLLNFFWCNKSLITKIIHEINQDRLFSSKNEYEIISLAEALENEDIGKAINEAMKNIEDENEELKGILPKTYNHLKNDTLFTLLKVMENY